MMDVRIFNSIHIKTPFKAIYKRLGFRQDATKISVPEINTLNNTIEEALGYIELRGAALRIAINKKEQGTVFLASGDDINSRLAATLLKEASEALFIAATSGHGIIKAIKKFQKENMTKSVIFDAAASEITDACLEWIINYFKTELCRENKQLASKRISCGYGDFTLPWQLRIYQMLQLKQLGIDITDSYMLIPEKSVTALTGIISK